MNKQNTTLKKAMLEALEQSLGIVTTAAKKAGIDRGSHYRWLKEDDDYKASVERLEDMTIDFAESQLHNQIKEGNTSATIFFLKCKAKKRGYVERVENVITVTEDLTPEQRQTEIERLKKNLKG